jgi:hypothetical protein
MMLHLVAVAVAAVILVVVVVVPHYQQRNSESRLIPELDFDYVAAEAMRAVEHPVMQVRQVCVVVARHPHLPRLLLPIESGTVVDGPSPHTDPVIPARQLEHRYLTSHSH